MCSGSSVPWTNRDSTPPTSPSDRTARANSLRAYLIVEELTRCGVEQFFVAPGSRSTPLVAAIANHPVARATVHYDERGTAFAALGHARATGMPAAWITTSGTAVANGLPAVVEASSDGVPMLLLTADRPPELRRTGANQTVDQPDIFGGYARWSFDVPAPDEDSDPASVLTMVDQAVHRARSVPRGPVHLNLMFREPLLPEPDEFPGIGDFAFPEHLSRWRESERPFTVYDRSPESPSDSLVEGIHDEVRDMERGIVIAGRMKTREQGEAVAELARSLGWPLLPDAGSQVRLGGTSPNVAAEYDLVLSNERFTETHQPECVLHFGRASVSKRLQQFLSRTRPPVFISVDDSPERLDPAHIVTRRVQADVAEFCGSLASRTAEGERTGGWTDGWVHASRTAGAEVEKVLRDSGGLSEVFVAREISRRIPEGHGFFVASSMPVRDVDTYALADGSAVPVVVNRGASGIDGTISTAAGYAIGSGGPVTVLIGDLALLHDLNSLAMVRDLPVTIVAINNDGGGIFSMLPVSRHESFFERFFGTPHGLGFADAARMFGLGYSAPDGPETFSESYTEATESGRANIIEVITDRTANTKLRRDIVSRVASLSL